MGPPDLNAAQHSIGATTRPQASSPTRPSATRVTAWAPATCLPLPCPTLVIPPLPSRLTRPPSPRRPRTAAPTASKPGRAFGNGHGNGNGNGGAAVLEPVIEGNGKRYLEPAAPVEEAFESVGPVMESVGPVVEGVGPIMEQGAMATAAGPHSSRL